MATARGQHDPKYRNRLCTA